MTKTKKLRIVYKKQFTLVLEILFWCAAFISGILYAKAIKQAMLQTLSFCVRSLVPTLFPYMILSSLLMRIFTDYQPPGVISGSQERKGMRLSPYLAFIIGSLCGFPVGAQVLVDLYNCGEINKNELRRLFPLCNQCSLAFVVLGIGRDLLVSSSIGFYLYFIMIASAALVSLLFPSKKSKESIEIRNSAQIARRSFVSIVRDATLATLYTIGFLLLFSIPIALIGHFSQNNLLSLLLTIPLEFTGACRLAISTIAASSPLLLPTLAFILSFGGICVGMQSELIVQVAGIGMSDYYPRKLLQGLFAFLIALLFSF